MNNDENHVLQLGENEKFQYEVTPKVQGILEEVMFHSYCLAKNKKELDEIERCLSKNIYVANAEERIAELIYAIKDEGSSLKDAIDDMEKNNVPNWVGSGAINFGINTDLTAHYISEFFENSQYAHGTVKSLQRDKSETEYHKKQEQDYYDLFQEEQDDYLCEEEYNDYNLE